MLNGTHSLLAYDPATVVAGLLSVCEVFGDELPEQAAFRRPLVESVAELLATRR